jgi:phosphatidylserine/phosphatidylglycerophosphate/cardiolipin synthase-like enzyme
MPVTHRDEVRQAMPSCLMRPLCVLPRQCSPASYGRAAQEAEKEPKVSLFRASIMATVVVALCSQGRSDPAPAIHYAPAENLERIDAALIDTAKHEIEMAAYVLTDWPVIQALTRAADRGVKVRIYLDAGQLSEREPAKVFQDLTATPTVEIRIKRGHDTPMHLKSYQVDGRLLRTGAANFSASGLKRQDNDLVVIENGQAGAAFKRNFDVRFASGEALQVGREE